jgi:hypothetical protein
MIPCGLVTFLRNILPPSSGLKFHPWWRMQYVPETRVAIYQATLRHISQDLSIFTAVASHIWLICPWLLSVFHAVVGERLAIIVGCEAWWALCHCKNRAYGECVFSDRPSVAVDWITGPGLEYRPAKEIPSLMFCVVLPTSSRQMAGHYLWLHHVHFLPDPFQFIQSFRLQLKLLRK